MSIKRRPLSARLRSRTASNARPRRTAPLIAAAAALASAWLPRPALAGPVEILADIAVHPSDPQKIVLGYEYGFAGLFVSNDGGHSFRIRPSESVHTLMPDNYFPRDNFPILFAPDALLVGGTGGLLSGDAESCNLTQGNTLLGDSIAAMAPHPGNVDEVFVVSTKSKAAHGGLFRRKKGGELAQLGADDDAKTVVTGLKVVTRDASSEHLRFVEVLSRSGTGGAQATNFVRYSDDLGATWTEHPVTLTGAISIKLLGVDPLDPERFLVAGIKPAPEASSGAPLADPPDDVLLSSDAGKNFSAYSTSVVSARYATFAPDGRFWLGDLAGGLHFANRLGDALKKVSDVQVNGLWFDKAASELIVAQPYELGRIKPADNSYCQMFRIYEAVAFANCPAEKIPDDSDTKFQVCMSYCNATHYWYAPVCKQYTKPADACGIGVLQTEFADQLPNTSDLPKRCDGFAVNYTDPSGAGQADAGAGTTTSTDAGAAAAADAGSQTGSDAAAPAEHEEHESDAGDASPSEPEESANDGGCSCSVPGNSDADRPWSALTLLAIGLVFLRLSRRAGTRTRAAAKLSLLSLLLALGGSGCSDDSSHDDTDDHDAGDDPGPGMPIVRCPDDIAHSPLEVEGASEDATMHAKVLSADHDPARTDLNSWTLELSDAQGAPIEDAEFANARTYMPVHGHDGTFPPKISHDSAGPGQYAFKDLNFTMVGPWQVQFEVSSESAGKDKFVLDVCVED